ncbi:hypothetical protein ACHAPJ_003405 [Fusarium lateritium]
MAPPPGSTAWSDLVEWNVEVDFLVAKKKPGKVYTAETGKRDRWACPANEDNPTETCVQHVAEHVASTLGTKGYAVGGVAYAEASDSDGLTFTIEKPNRKADVKGVDPCMQYWFISPAPNAVAKPESPDEYDWVGVRLRCPYRSLLSVYHADRFGEKNLGQGVQTDRPTIPPFRGFIEMEKALGLLRAGLKLHVNSTCQLRVYMNLQHDGFDLTDAKKAITLAWLLEPELLLFLRPNTKDQKLSHYLPITRESRIAKWPSRFPANVSAVLSQDVRERLLAQSGPLFPVDMELMDAYIPEMMKSRIQERIHMIWATSTLAELSNELKSQNGETTVSLNIHPRYHPTLVFRYGVWHPQREDMQYWVQLFGRLFLFAVASTPTRFKQAVLGLEYNALGLQRMNPVDRCKTMLTLSFDHGMGYYWDQLKQNEDGNGCLSPENLDRQGILPPVRGIDYDSDAQVQTESSSSFSNGNGSGLWINN